MFYIGRLGGINTQVRAISCFDSTITNTTGYRGSRQNSVHAGPPPKIHSPLHASTTSKNVFVRRPHCFQASDPLPTTFLVPTNLCFQLPTSINSIDIDRHQPFHHLYRRCPGSSEDASSQVPSRGKADMMPPAMIMRAMKHYYGTAAPPCPSIPKRCMMLHPWSFFC